MQLNMDDALLQAIEYHKIGNVEEANRFYQSILKVNPKHPDANHNLGLLITNHGSIIESYKYFKTALEANSQIPQFWYSYIDILIKLNKIEDAKTYYNKASEMGFCNGHDFKVLEEKLYENKCKNNILNNFEYTKPSQNQIDFIIKLFQERKYTDVQEIIFQLIEKFSNSSQLFHILGASFAELKDFGNAVMHYEKAIFLNSKDEMIWNDLGNCQRNLGLTTKSIESFKNSIKINQNCDLAFNNMGNSYKILGNTKSAITAYKKAIDINPDVSVYHQNLGQIYIEIDKKILALGYLEKAVLLNPNFENQLNLAEVILKEERNPKKALPFLDNALLLNPTDTRTIAYKTIALRGLNRFSEVKKVINFKKLVNPDNLKNHTIISVKEFNKTLLSFLINHPRRTIEKNTEGWAIRGGTVVRNIFSDKSEIIQQFEELTRRVIEKKIETLPDDINHPFLMKKPKSFELDCWANLLEAGDYQANHIHNNGWMSGVYYVDIPEIQNDNNKHAGWIEFNRAGYDLPHFGEDRDIEIIKPENGMYILFPSYVWHGTIPYTGKYNRVSISFDIIPN